VVVHRPRAGVALVPQTLLRISSLEITRWEFFVKNSSVLNSFGVTTIFSPARVISLLEKSTITSANMPSGLTRDARLISARTRNQFAWN
jgi:hypothetical protein